MKPAGIANVVCCLALLVTASTAAASDYTITWKNQFASNTTCTLNTSIVTLTGTIPNTTQYTFGSLGGRKPITVNSPTCSRIILSASCKYTDAKGQNRANSFGSQIATCGNSTATLNPSIPGSITVTNASDKPRGVIATD